MYILVQHPAVDLDMQFFRKPVQVHASETDGGLTLFQGLRSFQVLVHER
jgi:hypothetical protein